jgi:hypothetical protein
MRSWAGGGVRLEGLKKKETSRLFNDSLATAYHRLGIIHVNNNLHRLSYGLFQFILYKSPKYETVPLHTRIQRLLTAKKTQNMDYQAVGTRVKHLTNVNSPAPCWHCSSSTDTKLQNTGCAETHRKFSLPTLDIKSRPKTVIQPTYHILTAFFLPFYCVTVSSLYDSVSL